MNEQNVQKIISVKTKSSTPVITGAVGFMLGVPSVLCATICAGACAAAAAASDAVVAAAATAADPSLANDPDVAAASTAAAATAGALSLPLLAFIVSWILGFILCFFGKSNHSKLTGLLTILCGVAMGIPMAITFNIFGLSAAILYVISGGSAIANASKPE